jgi:hypothetical protein
MPQTRTLHCARADPSAVFRQFTLAAETPVSVADTLLQQVPVSPDAFPQKLDLVRDAVLLIRQDAAGYRAASFLDDRILGPATQGSWLQFHAVADAVAHARNLRPLHFIFHTGHVGSTLLSRLLDETGSVLPLREPLPLRTLADAHDVLGRPDSLLSEAEFERRIAVFTALWSRGYEATRCVVLKATSSAGRVAAPMLSRATASRAIYLNLRAEPYLATLLAGQNSPMDLRGHGQERIRRLQARTRAPLSPLHALSPGEMAAMSWLSESWTQDETLARHPDRVLALDFEAFLGSVEPCLARILAHFGLTHMPAQLSELARSPVLARYSKAPEYAYTPAERRAILDGSRATNRAEIRRGMAWLQQLGHVDQGVATVLDRRGL